LGAGAAQHGDLVAQRQDLGVFGVLERASSTSQLSKRSSIR
jgi:hypothetical protein